MEFTLPPLTQESFSRWYNKKVPRNDAVEERVVYPGMKLNCTTKSRDIRSQITASHVFVTQEVGTNVYHHKVVGTNNVFMSLPKRLYSHCFRNINIHSIPADNRIVVRLTESTSVTLPYIPDDFVAQKRSKRNATNRTSSKRELKKQKSERSARNSPGYQGWVTRVMSPATELSADMSIDSFQLMAYIRQQMHEHDEQIAVCIPNPFSGAHTISDIHACPEKQKALTTVIQFVHHYARHLV
jgi:hypothetical protein